MMKKPFSIAINGSMLDDHPTGVGVYAYQIINHLSKMYLTVPEINFSVFSPTKSNLEPGVQVIPISKWMKSSAYGKLAACWRIGWNFIAYPFLARPYDLLISLSSHGSLWVSNQILTIHDLLSLRFSNISFHQRLYFRYILPILTSRSRLILTVSETTKSDIVRYLGCSPDKIKVIPNGYDRMLYRPADSNVKKIKESFGHQHYFLGVGPTYPHKNFETLLLAYSRLSTVQKKRFPLLIAGGKKKYLTHLRKIANETGLTGSVHFLGYVPVALMPALYQEAVALVFPSLYEGFGIPLLEAMACGCPVIAANTSSVPEVCGEAAYYFDPTDATELQYALEAITADQQLRKELRLKGIAQATLFSWEKTAELIKQNIDHQFQTIQTTSYDSNQLLHRTVQQYSGRSKENY